MMHHYYYSDMLDGFGIAAGIVCLALVVCGIVAYFLAIHALVKAGRAKDIQVGNGALWFIGIFATPLLLAVIVFVTPDRGRRWPGHCAGDPYATPAARRDFAPEAPAPAPVQPAAPVAPAAPAAPAATAPAPAGPEYTQPIA